MPRPRLLLVEQDADQAHQWHQLLHRLEYQVVEIAAGAEQAEQFARAIDVDLTVVGLDVAGMGVQAAEALAVQHQIPIVCLIHPGAESHLERARHIKPLGFLFAPVSEQQLRWLIEIGLSKAGAERKAREKAQFQSMMMTGLVEAVVATDAEGIVQFLNPAAESLLGCNRGEVIGQVVTELFTLLHEETRMPIENPVRRLLRDRQPATGMTPLILVDHDGGETAVEEFASLMLDDQGQPAGVVLSFLDVTMRRQARKERERLDKKWQEIRKLDSLATLAGGIAHDLNGMLTTLTGFQTLAQRELPADGPVREHCNAAADALAQGCDLGRQLIAYAGRGQQVLIPLLFNELILEEEKLLRSRLSAGAALEFKLSQKTPAVQADRQQLLQVLMNLVSNANEALQGQTGSIIIRTGQLDLGRPDLYSPFAADDLPVGPYAFFEVTDTGCGLQDQQIPRVFDPFFSTKRVGRGMGMAAVLGIARKHRGIIRVASMPKQGSTFQVLIPAVSG